MFDDVYQVITTTGEGLYKDKGSKFIAIAFPATNENEIKEALASIKKKYFDARHHCYAYMLGADKATFRANDDGEPSGTAGKPILNQILSKNITNVCVVVVRYFGGIKLGVSGLITAYKTVAQEALENVTIETRTVNEIYALHFEYSLLKEVMRILKEEKIEPLTMQFELDCILEFGIRKSEANRVIERFKKIHKIAVKYIKTA
ncbi:MAG: YigZ family protein [Lentimicrobiaceae bacterium]|nr:YigZ family protein [Lentimicrobiaceae bacterium]